MRKDAATKLVEIVNSTVDGRLRDWIVQQAGGIPGVLIDATRIEEDLHRDSVSLRKQQSRRLRQSLEAKGDRSDFALLQALYRKNLVEASSPFAFSSVNERTILRFLRLIECDNSKIGTYAKLVADRNETAHPNGNIFFSEQGALDIKIREVLRVVAEIQAHSGPFMEQLYRRFLLESGDPDDREYPDEADQIREVLIHENYMSQEDINLCAAFALTQDEELRLHTNSAGIESLHTALAVPTPNKKWRREANRPEPEKCPRSVQAKFFPSALKSVSSSVSVAHSEGFEPPTF